VLWVTYIVKEVKHPPLHFSFTSCGVKTQLETPRLIATRSTG
jgi:hypothetical protein